MPRPTRNAERVADWRRRHALDSYAWQKRRAAAKGRAQRRLKDRYPGVYAELLREELLREVEDVRASSRQRPV